MPVHNMVVHLDNTSPNKQPATMRHRSVERPYSRGFVLPRIIQMYVCALPWAIKQSQALVVESPDFHVSIVATRSEDASVLRVPPGPVCNCARN